jgi:hypothetical protein
MLEPVEVKNPEAEKITLISSTTYEINNGLLLNTQANTTVETLLSQFENVDLKVLDSDGNEITNKTLIGTGATINLFSGDTLVDSVAVIISGDVDGNGRVNATDYARIKSAFLGTFSFNTMENIAADVDGNGVIDTTDYLRIKAHFLEMYNLYA